MVADKSQLRLRIRDDPSGLLGMQFSIDRHGHGAQEPNRIKRFEIFGAIAHEHRNPVALADPILRMQPAG